MIKRRRNRTLALAALPGLVAAAIVATGWPAQGAPFLDVNGELAHIANALGSRSMLPPVWGSTLSPQSPVYRYEMAWMTSALLDPKEHPFAVTAWPDVPPGHWALLAVNRIVGAGVLKDDEGKFNGDRRVRRDEFVTALEKVLSYRSIPPPPPRPGGYLSFPDARGANAHAIDRAANFWQFLEPEPRFRPGEVITRAEAVAMLVKAAPLVDQTFMSALATPTPPPPTPTPKATPWQRETPSPVGSDGLPIPDATPGVDANGSPLPGSTADPRPGWSWAPIAWRVSLAPALVAIGFSDAIVQKPGIIPLGGGDFDVTAWSGPVGGAARLNARVFPGEVPDNQAGTQTGKKTDYFFQVNGSGEALWNLGIPDADLAIGGGLGVSYQARTAVGLSSADRTFVGAGPAGRWRLPLGPLALEVGAQVHVGAAIPQSSGAGVAPGFGLGYQAEGRYALPLGSLELLAGTRGQVVSASGRTDALSGLVLGVGGGF